MLNSEDLINKVKVYNKFLNLERLDKAFNFAVKAHKNQKRASGDPYSVHPIEVANILFTHSIEVVMTISEIFIVFTFYHITVHTLALVLI